MAHAFNLRRVPYVIIGSVAVAIHLPAPSTSARTLGDLDIVIKPAEEAGLRACMAISSLISGSLESGGSLPPLNPHQLADGDVVRVPTLLGTLHVVGAHLPDAIDRSHLVARRKWVLIGRSPLPVCSLEDLIAIKAQVGRPKDISDAAALTHELNRRQGKVQHQD
jgi:hypothetical protein